MVHGIGQGQNTILKYMSSSVRSYQNPLFKEVNVESNVPVDKVMFFFRSIIPERTISTSKTKIDKILNSKQGKDAVRHFNDNIRLMDYWHSETDAEKKVMADIVTYADASLLKILERSFANKLLPSEKNDVKYTILENYFIKTKNCLNDLKGIQLRNVGQAADGILKSAEEREEHYQKIGKLLVEADFIDKDINEKLLKRNDYGDIITYAVKKATEEGKLTPEQIDTINKEFEMADYADEYRVAYVNARKDAENENIEIVTNAGPKALAAYKHLFYM